MMITILYARLFTDGSIMEYDIHKFKNQEFDMSIIPDVIAKFYKANNNVKITNIIIDRDGYKSIF